MKEETVVVNGFSITLPIGLAYNPKERRDDYASYLTPDKGLKDVRHHLLALTTLLAPQVSPKTKHVLHMFGGLGATAQVIHQIAPKAEHTFWERSESCCKYLSDEWDNVHHVEDSFKFMKEVDMAKFDVIIFDPSLGSILSPGVLEFWDHISKFHPYLIFVSDMATSKLHLNGKAYARVFGVETWNADDYAEAYDIYLRSLGKRIIGGIRDKFEMYFVVGKKSATKLKHPITLLE